MLLWGRTAAVYRNIQSLWESSGWKSSPRHPVLFIKGAKRIGFVVLMVTIVSMRQQFKNASQQIKKKTKNTLSWMAGLHMPRGLFSIVALGFQTTRLVLPSCCSESRQSHGRSHQGVARNCMFLQMTAKQSAKKIIYSQTANLLFLLSSSFSISSV